MLVAVLPGSLANEAHRNPASLLESMNRAVVGRTGGGFITACCVHFFPDSRLVLANAGQSAPCLDAHEIETDTGFPLGVSVDAN
ncbi:MAG: SpoIIE family protein phosphatase [Terracidiphilus sp.]|jgi:serine phosphatase RsbU (regulator of sigma subunit)